MIVELILLIFITALCAVAFSILSSSTPTDIPGLETQKNRRDLVKIVEEEGKKKKEEEESKKKKGEKTKEVEKQKHKKKQKSEDKRKPKSAPDIPKPRPSKFEPEEVIQPSEDTWEDAIYVPSVPVQNDTPTLKKKRENRLKKAAIQEKAAAKKEVDMPSTMEIERDLSRGFVVVQKKGPPPPTREQKQEREKLRRDMEEENHRKELETLERERERAKKRAEAAAMNEANMVDVKTMLEKQRKEKQLKEAERREVKSVIKEYSKVAEDAERRSWGASRMNEDDDAPAFDTMDYPRLQPGE